MKINMLSKKVKVVVCLLLIALLVISSCEARSQKRRKHKYEKKLAKHVAKQAIKQSTKQIFNTRETNTPNFVRLVLMRLIYGLAAQFGKYREPFRVLQNFSRLCMLRLGQWVWGLWQVIRFITRPSIILTKQSVIKTVIFWKY